MKLRSPYFVEDILKDQPYSSMLLISPYCDFQCEGCQNIHLKEEPIFNFGIDKLKEIYNKNPFFKGVTLAGLEPLLSGDEFWEDFYKFLEITEIENLTIYTRFDYNNSQVQEIIENIKEISCIQNFYIKCGEYNNKLDKKNIQIGNWEIEIASSNQTFNKVI